MPLRLASRAFQQGRDIPKKYRCDDDNISPPFTWSGVPDRTHRFLLTCDDTDTSPRRFHHQAAFDLPADWRQFEEGNGAEGRATEFRHAINDFGKLGYGGPCPPRSAHHYHFRLSALSEPKLPA
jgi:Raf kinase inhibitor-like YbhB/YbcL family protein